MIPAKSLDYDAVPLVVRTNSPFFFRRHCIERIGYQGDTCPVIIGVFDMSNDDLTIGILAGGDSSRFGGPKSLAQFHGKPLLSHMLATALSFSSKIIVVVSNEEQEMTIKQFVKEAKIVLDPDDSVRSALNGAVTAFEFSNTRYTMLLPVDTPLVNKGLLNFLLQLRNDHGAIVPCWPNGYVEPLHAVYLTEHAYSVGFDILESKKYKMQEFLDALTNVLYISTEVLKQFDSNLLSFENVNTSGDLKRLERNL